MRELADASFDDIVYFGADKTTIDLLNDKLAAGGIINVVLAGSTIGTPVSVGVGRIHYEGTRWIGTATASAADSYATIPPSGELRPGDSLLAVGAAGPMGQMHILRSLSAGVDGLTVVGTDLDDARLQSLLAKAEPLAGANGVSLRLVNTNSEPLVGIFSYHLILVPLPSLVADAVTASRGPRPDQHLCRDRRRDSPGHRPGPLHRGALLHVRVQWLGRQRHGGAAGKDRGRTAGHQPVC